MQKNQLIETLDGENLSIGSWPVELYYNRFLDDYIIKCKGVYITYEKFKEWRETGEDPKLVVGVNEEKVPVRIEKIENFYKIACLTVSASKLNKLENKITKLILCQKQNKS